MLHKAHTLIGIKIHALDGEMGHIDDFYFDDREWKIRYMIVRTGSWFSGKHVMLSPTTIRDVVWEKRTVNVELSQEQIRKSPDLTMELPVTREQEMELVHNTQWPSVWHGATGSVDSAISTMGYYPTDIPGMGVAPISSSGEFSNEIASDIYGTGMSDTSLLNQGMAGAPEVEAAQDISRAIQEGGLSNQLHEVKRLKGYQVVASDGGVGNISDFMIDDESWQIPSMLVDTTKWWPGGEVLVAMSLITGINWQRSEVHIKGSRDEVKRSPEYKG